MKISNNFTQKVVLTLTELVILFLYRKMFYDRMKRIVDTEDLQSFRKENADKSGSILCNNFLLITVFSLITVELFL